MLTREQITNETLTSTAISLDISPSDYKKAIERYASLKEHLEEGYYPDTDSPPDIYIQGSFSLGTVIRPYKEGKDCNYDIDVVSRLEQKKELTDPAGLKDDVGEEVKNYANKNSMKEPENKRRCWVLKYAPDSNGIGFHMDVLPCLTDHAMAEYISRENPHLEQYANTTIAITNRDDDIKPPKYDWRSGNPRGYAKWFLDINRPGFVIFEKEQRQQLYENNRSIYSRDIDVPNELIRTPLQRVIQILKRHRDIYFTGHKLEKYKPISMIITTLAAKLYEGNADHLRSDYSALDYIVGQLVTHAGLLEKQYLTENVAKLRLIQRVDNKWYISNPVNPHNPGDSEDKGENFADRWDEDGHAGAKAFFDWIRNIKDTFEHILQKASLEETPKMLGDILKISGTSYQSHTLNINTKVPIIPIKSLSRSLFNVPHKESPQWTISLSLAYSVYIRAFISRDDYNWSDISSNTSPLPKNYTLKFEARTNMSDPFDVFWQVVNTGDEASRENDLRGGFIRSNLGDVIRKETTRYKGQHWIECFIVKNNICVARSGEFVVNIQ